MGCRESTSKWKMVDDVGSFRDLVNNAVRNKRIAEVWAFVLEKEVGYDIYKDVKYTLTEKTGRAPR